tara:strand:- start:3190 stop:3462 length:273 start_codon:yes stop_codon:yes gene_type:complete
VRGIFTRSLALAQPEGVFAFSSIQLWTIGMERSKADHTGDGYGDANDEEVAEERSDEHTRDDHADADAGSRKRKHCPTSKKHRHSEDEDQ